MRAKYSLVVILSWLLSGCASVKRIDTGRVGFFDRLFTGSKSEKSLPLEDGDPDELAQGFDSVVATWSAPVRNAVITSPFGGRGRGYHDGLDFRAGVGTAIYSVADGQVVYAGSRISGYGKMIVVRHDQGLSTVYAHNSKILVRLGARVKKGQLISYSGRTGRVRGPHLHFEVRRGITAIDPQKLGGGEWLTRFPDRKLASEKPPQVRRKRRYARTDISA
jgi:murein DD-endopeptidase MepM/ murein hydrolase activator NlpD